MRPIIVFSLFLFSCSRLQYPIVTKYKELGGKDKQMSIRNPTPNDNRNPVKPKLKVGDVPKFIILASLGGIIIFSIK